METLSIPFLIIFGIGTLNGLFLSIYFFFHPRGRKGPNRILALLLWVFALRISKLVIVHFFENIHGFYDTLWYTGLASTGILLYLYLVFLEQRGPMNKQLVYHFSLPLLFQLFQMFSSWSRKWFVQFGIAVLSLVIYSVFSFTKIFRILHNHRSKLIRRWIIGILFFFMAEGILFITFFIVRYPFMKVEAILYSLVIYFFVFSELRWKVVQRVHRMAFGENGTDDKLHKRLIQVMEEERLYLSPNLTLTELAKSIGTTPHKLSHYLNVQFGRNFNDFVNFYRIEEAKRRLLDPINQNKTIASIAYDCGFNSLSVFNPAFKKFTGKSPSKFQSQK